MKITNLIFLALLCSFSFSSCDKDDEDDTNNDNPPIATPLDEGVEITLRNTLQDPGEDEGSYPSLFGQPDDAYDEFATLSNSTIEFETALAQSGTPAGDVSGLYSINFTENKIEYSLIAAEDDPFWGGIADVFGIIPADKFDRYYFTFSEAHNISSFNSTDSSVNLRIDSDNVIVIEITEGFEVAPGASFTINLN